MMRLGLLLGASLALGFFPVAVLQAGERELRTVESATLVIRDLGALKLQGIPQGLLREARGVAIIPGVIKAGFLIDGRVGQGVVLARQPDGSWSNPVFVGLAGLGIGWQAGVQSTDVVLVFRTAHSVDRILRGQGKITLGGDVSVAVGPVGRAFEAATDARLEAEIYSYSRSRGLFAGLSVEGASLHINPRANDAFYGLQRGQPAPVLAQRETTAVESLKAWLNTIGPPAGAAAPVPPAPVLVPTPQVPAPAPLPFPPATPAPGVPPPPPPPPPSR
jgi:lipid-binding SYLF domain-containing protein